MQVRFRKYIWLETAIKKEIIEMMEKEHIIDFNLLDNKLDYWVSKEMVKYCNKNNVRLQWDIDYKSSKGDFDIIVME